MSSTNLFVAIGHRRTFSYIYKNTSDHVHDDELQVASLRPTVRSDLLEKVKSLLQLGAFPKIISDQIRNDADIEVKPTNGQVSYCLIFSIHI